MPRLLNADCWDIDSDGVPEIVLAYRFESHPEKSVGKVMLLKSGPDVRKPWTAREIDHIPTAHRVRWIDCEGNGNQVAVYTPQHEQWIRTVIEDTMQNGHALAVGDLDADGRDEIVSGFRGKGYQLSIYQDADLQGKRWNKTVLDDGGIAGADCLVEDFTGNGRPDIICIGASTGNVNLYENLAH
ncbi:MAG: VCBS repeat-containing protein [Pirellulales bacterium]|nr:VCBS repeat-containing protein [Pirellulales bacterium]